MANLAGTDGVVGSANGTGAAAQFNAPAGICFDSTKNQVLIADSGNNSVRALPLTFTSGNLSGGAVSTKLSGLSGPKSVSVASNGTIAVVETAVHRVRLYSGGYSLVTFFGGVSGNVVGDGNTGRFATPSSVVAVGDAFLIADAGNLVIKRLAVKPGADTSQPSSWNVAFLAGTGSAGGADGTGDVSTFASLGFLATDSLSRLLVPDATSNSLRRILSTGSFDFGTPDGGGTGQASLVNPTGFVDLNGLQRPYIDVAQRIEPGQSVDIGEWQFSIPSSVHAFRFSVTVEAGTSVYSPLEAVLNPVGGPGSPNVVAQFLSRGTFGSAFTGTVGDIAMDTGASYFAVAADGTVFMTQATSGVICRMDVDGTVSLVAGRAGNLATVDGTGDLARFAFPDMVMCNPAGTELFVVDESGHVVRRVALASTFANPKLASSWVVSTVAGAAGTSGDADGTGDVARFRTPAGLCGPNNDTFFVAEYGGRRIRAVRYLGGPRDAPTSWSVTLVAGSSIAQGGAVDGIGSNARFGSPLGICYSPDAKVYIADRANRLVRCLDTLTYTVSTVAGIVSNSSGFDNDNALAGTLSYPNAVATDASGAVFISDNHKIRRLLNGSLMTVAGGGTGAGTSGDQVSFSNTLFGLALTSQGDLLINGNSRLVRLTRRIGR